ncbi:MAG: HAD family phosphatase [Acidobacteria bacterium]|nr:MAG: HAD family phosphatase [Acidobacteriota bacterium]
MAVDTNGRPALIFDFGNVLVAWDPWLLYSKLLKDREALDAFLAEVRFFEWNLEQDKGRPFQEGIKELCTLFPHRSDLIQAYDERWEESIGGPIEESVSILRQLKHAGYRLYGLSNWSAEKFNLIRHRYPFFNWFDDIVLSGEVGLVKPDPRVYELMLEKIGKPASACLFIDDARHNVEVADRLGFQTIHFTSPEQLRVELEKRGVLTCV